MKHIQTFDSFINEGNAFFAARAKAVEEGLEEFEFNGKVYKVTTKTKEVNESGPLPLPIGTYKVVNTSNKEKYSG